MLNGHHHPIGGRVGAQGTGAEALRMRSQLIPFQVCASPWQWRLCSSWGAAVEQQGLAGQARVSAETSLASSSEPQAIFRLFPGVHAGDGFLLPVQRRGCAQGSFLLSKSEHSCWRRQPLQQCPALEREELERAPGQAGEQAVAVVGNQPAAQAVFSLFPLPCSMRVSKCVHVLHEQCWFLAALW